MKSKRKGILLHCGSLGLRAMSYCTNCGTPAGGAKFCPNCGHALAGESPNVTEATSTQATVEDVQVAGTPGTPPPVAPVPATANQKPPRSGPSKTLLAIAVVGLAVLLAGVIGYLFSTTMSTPKAADATTSPTPTATPTTPKPTPTTTVTKVAPQPTVTVTEQGPDNSNNGGGNSGGKDCGSSVTAVGPTSCPFALAVSEAYSNSGGSSYLPSVYSPVTGQYYSMTCDRSVYPVRCEGGNDAVVLIR